jgi:hypothetical protein
MKIKYFNSRVNLAESTNLFYWFLIAFFILGNTNAQVTITKPNLSIIACSVFPSGYYPLGNIVITENQNNNFSNNASPLTLVLTAPANFQFNAGDGSVSVTGTNLSGATILVAATTITITYTCSNTNKLDVMTISGIQIRAINAASNGNITRTGGTGIINGLDNTTTLTNTLTSTLAPNLPASVTIGASANSVCSGNNVTFTATPTNGGISPSYQWKRNGVNIGGNSAIYSNSALANGDVISCILTSNATPCLTSSPATSNSISMTVNPILPASVTIATSVNSICTGDPVTFTASTTNGGSSPSYQWMQNGANVGTDSATYTSSSLINGDVISCVFISNATPCLSGNPATSNTIAMTVNSIPIITTQPTATSVCTNGTTTFSISATGTTTFQWRKNGVNLSNSAIFSGVNSATLTITNPNISNNGDTFDVLLNGATCPVLSDSAPLTVFEKVQITSQPITSQIFCEGNSTTMSITAIGDGLTYQWFKGTTAILDGGAISGANSATLTINPIVLNDGGTYHCVVNDTSPCNPVTSNDSVLNINQGPLIINPPISSQTICEGSPVSFSVGATVGTLSYQWYKGAIALNNGGSISGAKSATLTINPVIISDADVDYNCIVNNGCFTETRSSALVVNPKPNAFVTNSAQTICSGNTITTMVLSGSGTTYNWTRNNTANVTGIATIGNSDISGNLINTTNATVTVTFTIIPVDNSCNGNPITATVLVKPTPTVIATNAAQTICSGSTISTMALSGNVAGTSYNWTRDNIASITGIASSGSGNISGILTNPTNAPITVTFTIIPTANGCSGNTITTTVLVESTSVGGTLSQPVTTVCTNANNGTLTLSGAIGSVVRWDFSSNGGVNWTPIINTTNSLVYSNLSQTTLYRVVIKNGTCPIVYSTNAVVSVIPSYSPTATGLPLTICAGDTTTLSATSGLPIIGITDGTFNTANPSGWCVDGKCSGGFMPANGDNQDAGVWRETNNQSFNGVTYSSPDPKFAIANGNFNSTLETPVFSLIGQSNSNFQFLEAYILEATASAKIEISTNGGTSYPIVLAQYNGPSNLGVSGSIATMQSISLSLANFIGLSNLKIRFTYAGTANSGWVLDGITIPNTPPAIIYTWTPNATLTPASGIGQPVIAKPATTTTYTLNTTVGGCPSGSQNITITVNQKPIVTATPSAATICSGETSSISLTSTETGTTFTWTVAQTNVSGASAGTGNSIAQALTATGTTTGTVVYTISSTSKGCIGIPKIITVTVNPRPSAAIQTSRIICNNTTTSFKVLLTGTAPWTITYSDGIIATTTTTSTNPFFFSIPNITTNRSYTITALSDSNCSSKPIDLSGTSVVTVLNGTAGLWTGLESTDWFDCLNWAGGLPSTTNDAQIPTTPSGSSRMPVIDRSSPFANSYNYIANARDLSVATGASVTVVSTNNSELQISRDWKNSGQFIPGTGTVTFNGASLNQIQTINLGIKTNETFYNLTTNNSGGAKGISVVDGFELTVKNNVELISGDLRLTGEAQLIQEGTNPNPGGGVGKLFRDQQGQKNSFNYNYWSSPVNSSVDFAYYSINGVLKDGTDITNVISVSNFNQENITFGDGAYFADGVATNPIKISNRWLYSYNSQTPDSNTGLQNYYLWNPIGNSGKLKIGEGFTMKGIDGSASLSSLQNYVFIGKPNSGTIALNLPENQTYLIGNPYPSALDADEFIRDNLKDCTNCRASANIFNGALYFWDHFDSSNNHYLAQYVGGYATYTLMGGLPAIANDPLTVNNGSSGSKFPKRYIPVSQGFFVDAALAPSIIGTSTTISDGVLNFKNSQRAFVTESTPSSIFMKTSETNKIKASEIDIRPKIRLGFDTAIGSHRQLLLGADIHTTSQFDLGYDAPMNDSNANDMFWVINDIPLVIQAVPDFNTDRTVPIGVKIGNEGNVTFKIDALENILSNTPIYLYDAENGTYNDIRNAVYTTSLAIGKYNNRFSLRFMDATLNLDESMLKNEIIVSYSNKYKLLTIKNNQLDTTINSVSIITILGQESAQWNLENSEQSDIQIPIKNSASGIYIVKVKTSKGEINKKIIFN